MMSSTTIILRRFSAVHSISSGSRLLPRTIHGSCVTQRQPDPPNPVSHSTDNYFVDRDETPPPDNSVYKVDTASDAAQSAYEPPSGPWNRAGAGTAEYRTVSQDKPYDVPGDPDVKLRYGGKKRYEEGRGSETSKPGEGPEGSERGGRKPEGRA